MSQKQKDIKIWNDTKIIQILKQVAARNPDASINVTQISLGQVCIGNDAINALPPPDDGQDFIEVTGQDVPALEAPAEKTSNDYVPFVSRKDAKVDYLSQLSDAFIDEFALTLDEIPEKRLHTIMKLCFTIAVKKFSYSRAAFYSDIAQYLGISKRSVRHNLNQYDLTRSKLLKAMKDDNSDTS